MKFHDYYLSVPTEADMPEIPPGADLELIKERPDDIPGWHFNVRSSKAIDWPASVTQYTPATPWRVWG